MPRFFRAPERPVRLLVILDSSSSMAGYQAKVTEALHDFFHRLAGSPGEYLVTLVEFSGPSQIRIATRAAPASEVSFYYQPEGSTALWDAIGCGLEAEATTTQPVVCLIITDGEENGSRERTQ